MEPSLLVTKMHVPPVRQEWVARPRLLERLHHTLQCRLALISAPAGFGQTTLVSSWLSGVEHPATTSPPETPQPLTARI